MDIPLREHRISTLHWVLRNISENTIRREVIIELIPYKSLSHLLSELEMEERYEDCMVVFSIMKLYNESERNGEFKQLF